MEHYGKLTGTWEIKIFFLNRSFQILHDAKETFRALYGRRFVEPKHDAFYNSYYRNICVGRLRYRYQMVSAQQQAVGAIFAESRG